MPRRPIAKKAPAKPKRLSVAERLRREYSRGFSHGSSTNHHHLEAKITDLALHITLQERTIARLLNLLVEPRNENEIRDVQAEVIALHTRVRTVN